MDYDSALETYLGKWGPYYWKTIATFFPLGTPLMMILTESIFQTAAPPYECSDPGPGLTTDAQCQIPNINGTNSTADLSYGDCTSWDFNAEKYGRTIITEWSLVCSRSWVPGAAQSAVMAGLMVGAFFAGIASDRFGRRPVCLANLAMLLVVRVAAIFCPNYTCFIATKFLMSAFSVGFYTPAYIDCVESVVPRHRFLFAVITSSTVGATIAIEAAIAYVVKDWFHITIIYSIFLLPFIFYFKILNESPQWLLSKGRNDEAQAIFKQMVKSNGETLPDDFKLQNSIDKGSADYGLMDFFKSRVLLMYLLVNIFIWEVDVLLYYSLTLNAVTLFGNLYLNAAAIGLIEIPAMPISQVLSNSRLGRRGTLALTLVLAGGTVMGANFVKQELLQLALYLASKLAISTAFTVSYIYTPELFPTSLRNRALGICSQMGRLGAVFGPFIASLAKFWPPLPHVLIGGAAVGAGLLTLLLPETRGHHMPQTVEDSAQLRKRAPPSTDQVQQNGNRHEKHDLISKVSEPDVTKV